MTNDPSEGWEAIAEEFRRVRSAVGAAPVRDWALAHLPASGAIVDIGCGDGAPVAKALIKAGFAVSGIDASPSLLEAFRSAFPGAPAVCEAAQESAFFGRRFDGAIAVGLVFLLAEDDQRKLIARVADALHQGGRFLFSAPREACDWKDRLTGRRSVSLGAAQYEALLAGAGFTLADGFTDEGGNYYYDAVKAG